MPDEPNKNAESLLRNYASKRRELPETQLHPVTRRILQDEVRRVHATPRRSGFGWRAYLPQIAFGSALCLVIGLTLAVLRLPPEEKQLAQIAAVKDKEIQEKQLTDHASTDQPSRVKQEKPDLPAATQPVKAEARNIPTEEPSLFKEQKLTLTRERSLDEARQERVPEIERDSLSVLKKTAELNDAKISPVKQKSDEDGRFDLGKPAIALATPASAAAAPPTQPTAADSRANKPLETERLLVANEPTNLGAAMRTHFIQTNVAATPILRSFQFEQLGQQVRFVDLDGSVYSGNMQPTVLTAAGAVGGAAFASPESAAADNAAVYSFQASGTNRTIGRLISLQGQYFNKTNVQTPATLRLQLAESQRRTISGPQQQQQRAAQAQQVKELILGRTVIGGTNEQPLNAISLEQ